MCVNLHQAYMFQCLPGCGKQTAILQTPVGDDSLDPQYSKEIKEAVSSDGAALFVQPVQVQCAHCEKRHKVKDEH